MLKKPSNEDTTLTSDIKLKMCSVLQGKYEPAALQELLEKACFLDPRYRGDYINDTETKYKLIERWWEWEDEGALPVRQWLETKASGGATCSKKKTLGDLLKSRTTSASAPIPKRARADNELTRYLQEESIDSNANPLFW